MNGVEQPEKDDMVLHDYGPHRDIYNYLVKELGLKVQPERGPVWYRAKRLLERAASEP